MRVLMTLDAVGGVWRYSLDLARALGSHGVECLLTGLGPPPDAAQRAECDAIPNTWLAWINHALDWTVADPAVLRPSAQRLAALAREWRADLIQVNVPSQAAWLDCPQPIVVASHSCVPTWWQSVRRSELPADLAWHRDLTLRGLRRADALVVPSRSHGEALDHTYGVGLHWQVVHNAVPPGPPPAAKQDMILSVGRWWDEGKNGRVLDEAAPHAPWPIILAGALHGPNGASTQFAHVETTGALPPPEIRTLMQRAAIFAAPSLYEPFGLAVAEAATAGAALVLSDIPTFRELWHGAALFVPPDQPQAWAQAFHSLANDVTLRQRLSATAKHRVATFTLGRQAEEIHAVYRSLKTAAAA